MFSMNLEYGNKYKNVCFNLKCHLGVIFGINSLPKRDNKVIAKLPIKQSIKHSILNCHQKLINFILSVTRQL